MVHEGAQDSRHQDAHPKPTGLFWVHRELHRGILVAECTMPSNCKPNLGRLRGPVLHLSFPPHLRACSKAFCGQLFTQQYMHRHSSANARMFKMIRSAAMSHTHNIIIYTCMFICRHMHIHIHIHICVE